MRSLTLPVLFLIIGTCYASSSEKHSEQSCVGIPDSAKLPDAVIRVVMDSEQGKFAKQYFRDHGLDPYRSAPLRGVRVTLTNSGDRNYLVGGSTPMTGGDNRWFWLVQGSADGHAKILLYVGASCVQVEQNTSGGYRNVWTRWQTAGKATIREYQWDGHHYRLVKRYATKSMW